MTEWEVGGRFKRERTSVYLWLIHVDIWQKPTQYYEASILQLKLNKLKKIISRFFLPVFSQWPEMTAAVPRVTCINIQRQENEAQINSLLFMSEDTASQNPQ